MSIGSGAGSVCGGATITPPNNTERGGGKQLIIKGGRKKKDNNIYNNTDKYSPLFIYIHITGMKHGVLLCYVYKN